MEHIAPEQIAQRGAQAEREGKIEPLVNVDVIDEQGGIVTQVEQRLYIRCKK